MKCPSLIKEEEKEEEWGTGKQETQLSSLTLCPCFEA